MSELSRVVLEEVVRDLPESVRELLRVTPGLVLAGGFVRAIQQCSEPNDIDLFVNTPEQAQEVASVLSLALGVPYHRTKNAYTLKSDETIYPVQIIHRWTFDGPRQVAESFDFTMCQAAVWFDFGDGAWHSWCADTFADDAEARRLVYTAPDRHEDVGGSMLRVIRFIKRGYDITPIELAKVVARLTAHDRDIEPAWGAAIYGRLTDAYRTPRV